MVQHLQKELIMLLTAGSSLCHCLQIIHMCPEWD